MPAFAQRAERRSGSDRRRDPAPAAPRVSVIAISVAFGEFWSDLAADLHCTIDLHTRETESIPRSPETMAVIVAAGGAEDEAIPWLANRALPRDIPVFVVGTDPGRRTAMQLVAQGAKDYFALPEDLEIFRNALAAECRAHHARAAIASVAPDPFATIVGESSVLKKELARAALLMQHRHARALIIGETGTGKEVLARAIHTGGPRRDAPFVAVNCSAFPEHLIESELFGHERGSFTDAHAAKPGLFEVADTGTLFLDEIGDLPLSLQAKLLRVLEDKEIRRVGGTKSRPVDVRILAATNEQLADRVAAGSFRQDLYFRLSAVVLRLPPLRERGDDVLLVADALLGQVAQEHGLPRPILTPEVSRQLRAHPWPGNVRELKNALERALLLSPSGALSAEELLPPVDRPSQSDGQLPFPAPLQEITTAAAHATVKLCGGNRSESARRLGISPRRLRRLLNGLADGEEDVLELSS